MMIIFVSDERTGGRMDGAKTVHPPPLRSGGIIKYKSDGYKCGQQVNYTPFLIQKYIDHL